MFSKLMAAGVALSIERASHALAKNLARKSGKYSFEHEQQIVRHCACKDSTALVSAP